MTNLNWQLGALHSTPGMPKAEALAARVRDISPDCRVTPVVKRYEGACREEFSASAMILWWWTPSTWSPCKLDLIQTALERGIPMISALGHGQQAGPQPVPHQRHLPKQRAVPGTGGAQGTAQSRGSITTRVVWSPELPAVTDQSGEALPPGRRSVPASVSWCPPARG